MVLIRTLLVLFAVVASTAVAGAADSWRIVAATGTVKAGGPGIVPVAVNDRQTLPADSWVETGASGRAVLARGVESIVVSPNSRVLLPSQTVNGNTQVLQTLGSAFYQIGKQKEPHFQVDTPYLAAVVKGTTFVITVSEGAATVDVSEGLVEVATPDGGHSAFVEPGFTAIVARSQRGTVQVVPTSHAPSQDAAPKGQTNDALKESTSHKDDATILAAIGEVSVDVKAASGGLVSAIEPQADGTVKSAIVKDAVGTVVSAKADVAVADTSVGVGGASSGVSAEVGGGAGSGGVSVEVGVGAGAGGVSAEVGVGAGAGGVSAEVGLGAGNGNGGSGGLTLGVGNGNAGVGVSLGNGNGGLGVGLGNGS